VSVVIPLAAGQRGAASWSRFSSPTTTPSSAGDSSRSSTRCRTSSPSKRRAAGRKRFWRCSTTATTWSW